MSSTVAGEYNGFDFWACDVSSSILLAEMAKAAEEPAPQDTDSWLTALTRELRIHAIVGAEHGLPLDEWADGHENEFISLIEKACERLAARMAVTAEEASGRRLLDGRTVIWRGHEQLSTTPIITLGEALVKIIQRKYPPAPAGHWWYFGVHGPDGPTSTIRMRDEGFA
ncbi:hypothetical protein ACFWY9_27680 [Amycolatopsis sp. NPDC059027]|uniref:hypothetical protein n=1 Tax=unclassified Amycolatopsis TaxID=2618356 RepID=UPI00367006A1